jgi:hypothetical protein
MASHAPKAWACCSSGRNGSQVAKITANRWPFRCTLLAASVTMTLMTATEVQKLDRLYDRDETAWLEAMSLLAAEGRLSEMDFPHLSEYLADMARRDRREVFSRLVVLLTHMLKWEQQPDRRSGSWRGSIREQRREFRQLLESGTLRNHAESVLTDAFHEARLQAADETELDVKSFPVENPWSLEDMLAEEEA